MTDLPKPAVWQWEDLFTATQMREYRNAALEEAAKVCEKLATTDCNDSNITRKECAAAIRALMEN